MLADDVFENDSGRFYGFFQKLLYILLEKMASPKPIPALPPFSKQIKAVRDSLNSRTIPVFHNKNFTEIAFSTEIYNWLTFSWLSFTEQPKTTTITESEAEEERNKTRYLFRSKPNVHEATLL